MRIPPLAAVAFFAQIVPTLAQTPAAPRMTEPPANCAPTQATPGPNGISATGRPGEPLGDKLARSDGVLCPPPGVDPEIRAPTPDGGAAKMPVIPPPGSPGGDPTVRPK